MPCCSLQQSCCTFPLACHTVCCNSPVAPSHGMPLQQSCCNLPLACRAVRSTSLQQSCCNLPPAFHAVRCNNSQKKRRTGSVKKYPPIGNRALQHPPIHHHKHHLSQSFPHENTILTTFITLTLVAARCSSAVVVPSQVNGPGAVTLSSLLSTIIVAHLPCL